MGAADFIDAVVHYRTLFRTKEALGAGDPPDKWWAELQKVAPTAMDPVLATSVNLDGGGFGGVQNFDQIHKVRALHAVRSELDSSYVNPYTRPLPASIRGTRIGSVVRLGL